MFVAYHLHLFVKTNLLFCLSTIDNTKLPYNFSIICSMKPINIILRITWILILIFSLTSRVFAQNGYYLDDEGVSLWEQEQFLDATGREFETFDRQYVGEEEIKAAEEAARRAGLPGFDIAAAIEQDKELMPDNIVYGIGTGALIGGWLALVQGKNARENVRNLSVGIITGVLLGITLGTKSLYIRQTKPVANIEKKESIPIINFATDFPVLKKGSNGNTNMLAHIDFQFKF